MNSFDKKFGLLHFIGIGGIGMSGIAEVLFNLGYKVSGSDLVENQNVIRLKSLGVNVRIGHEKENVDEAAMVVVSSAIDPENEEVVEAKKQRIPIVKRAEMLAELMRFKKSISVAGTHGKTTTTSLMATILESADLDPTVINGGIINSYKSNAKIGSSDWMVVEADESDGSFIKLPSTNIIVTNIDAEHLDYYGNFRALKDAFKQFINNIPFYGMAIVCLDNPTIQSILSEIEDKRIITYGISPQADYKAQNIKSVNGRTSFTLEISPKVHSPTKSVNGLISNIPGIHNVQNVLAVCAMAIEMGIKIEIIKTALEGFEGVNRRFSLLSSYRGIKVYDDYGHHPVEIRATLSAAREVSKNKVVAIVQPHRYSRLKMLFADFTTAFNDADTVFVTNIFSAGEKEDKELTTENLISALVASGHKDVRKYEDLKQLKTFLEEHLKEGDVIIFLGAGNITQYAKNFSDLLGKEGK
ncbi:MAG: UDP-N-acetylmuramate--L-alanine ligase [Alphaproteobacteria bacterium MarineAlpha9_Bin4]|nr:UDP-N-acetylmuramate--L-alanine ligase [Pelagibacterales bacterium]PPR27672.1 MAG: UDP-N-acetylmuramate--L-alanine ligase [Alphaproteobacteria bacterium MarineAlpha9_Bin4]|tara:strand:- start:1237 stop:2646 length:1410 start_codon:yes stop_codon:yes gene_type:complete